MKVLTVTKDGNSNICRLSDKASVSYAYELIDLFHPQRSRVESFIAQRFMHAHGAQISQFMPHLIALFNARGNIVAALGLRHAAQESLFLEHYLQRPIEQVISSSQLSYGSTVSRKDIVEIGNLASIDRFASRKLFKVLAELLINEGYQWATFTGCSSLRKIFGLLGIDTITLASASETHLPENLQNWGSYYDDNPCVLAGHVNSGQSLLDRSDFLNQNGAQYEIAV